MRFQRLVPRQCLSFLQQRREKQKVVCAVSSWSSGEAASPSSGTCQIAGNTPDRYRFGLPQPNSSRDSLLLVQRTWNIMKQQHSSSLDGRTYYVLFYDKFFEQLERNSQALTTLFGSYMKEMMRSFDAFVYLVRKALECDITVPKVQRGDTTRFDEICNEFGARSVEKGIIAGDLWLLEAAFIAALRFVVFDFVKSNQKRTEVVCAWTKAVQLALKKIVKAHLNHTRSTSFVIVKTTLKQQREPGPRSAWRFRGNTKNDRPQYSKISSVASRSTVSSTTKIWDSSM
ncbi:unnamed protein product [Heterosigma akashiwo]|mmetsp:Transcript_21692/g.34777  ORF Transcript_21692/g.34777 Transcript_21692/m.34777 type:complete len:286 (+) Transcript_21692:52-909(+)